jgi:RNA polymerase sigma-70 factor (ECF subfamily)
MFAVAYRMLGTVADAEDAVQDAWLRWSAEPRPGVASPRAYLVRIAANTALNRLRSARTRREAYIGPWLPEPLLTQDGPDVGERAELAESVSLAMLVVLESLTPDERAVFVLREVFGFGYAEIGTALGRSAPAVRQLAHRAREHVQARRPRFDVDSGQQREVTERFLAAAAGGDIGGLMTVLGPDKVARFLVAITHRPYMGVQIADMTVTVTGINGTPGTVVTAGGRPIAALTLVVSGGLVTAIQLVASPDKLAAIAAGRTLPL